MKKSMKENKKKNRRHENISLHGFYTFFTYIDFPPFLCNPLYVFFFSVKWVNLLNHGAILLLRILTDILTFFYVIQSICFLYLLLLIYFMLCECGEDEEKKEFNMRNPLCFCFIKNIFKLRFFVLFFLYK